MCGILVVGLGDAQSGTGEYGMKDIRLADLRITPVRRRRKDDIFCASCGQFHEPTLHPPVRDVLGLAKTKEREA